MKINLNCKESYQSMVDKFKSKPVIELIRYYDINNIVDNETAKFMINTIYMYIRQEQHK